MNNLTESERAYITNFCALEALELELTPTQKSILRHGFERGYSEHKRIMDELMDKLLHG